MHQAVPCADFLNPSLALDSPFRRMEMGSLYGGDVAADEETICINIGGHRHTTLTSTLFKIEGTRLYALAKRHVSGRNRKKEYFYDRHPGVFSSVLDYYRSGELHVPLDICGAVVKREYEFWKIDDSSVEACCWTDYSTFLDNQKTLAEFNKEVNDERAELDRINSLTGWRKKQMAIWMTLDHPRSSNLALGFAVLSFIFVLLSITGFCLETLPSLQREVNVSGDCGGTNNGTSAKNYESHPFLYYLDYVCTAFFTVELLVRIVFAPNKLGFFRSFMNLIDILALLPLYVEIFLDMSDKQNCLKTDRAVVETIFILRIVRIFRIFHLVKHYKSLKILVHAIRASVQELLMLSIFLFIATLVFATLIFYAERSGVDVDVANAADFSTIPIGFWWAIITMTTVGYGDVYPKTPLGCAIGTLCAVWGVLLLALTIPVISNNFTLFYMHARTRDVVETKTMKDPKHHESDEEGLDEDHTIESSKYPKGFIEKHLLTSGTDSSKALLRHADSNSTVDETLLLNTRPGSDESGPTTPQKTVNGRRTGNSAETRM